MVEEMLSASISAMMFGLSALSANLLLVRHRNRAVNYPLAAFFLCIAVLQVPEILGLFEPRDGPGSMEDILETLTMPLTVALAPLMWLYARALTEEEYAHMSWRDLGHFIPCALAFAVVFLLFSLRFVEPATVAAGAEINLDSDAGPDYVDLLTGIAYNVQFGIYVALLLWRLTTYRKKLKQMFASTENRELGWILWLGLFIGGFWLLDMATVFFEEIYGWEPFTEMLTGPFTLFLVWSIAIWGLRQRPGFEQSAPVSEEILSPAIAEPIKYERSALSETRAQRIAAKIEGAMMRDQLYANPNLSLVDLSKHIGVTSNHVSQTLNGTIGENFFDYINRWRVRDAVRQLEATDKTILAIAYDVGFNSRSSFYTAFKRETGQTPTKLRKSLSAKLVVATETAGG